MKKKTYNLENVPVTFKVMSNIKFWGTSRLCWSFILDLTDYSSLAKVAIKKSTQDRAYFQVCLSYVLIFSLFHHMWKHHDTLLLDTDKKFR